MKIVIHASRIEWQTRWAKYVATGLRKHGHQVTITPANRPVPCDMAVLMGPNAYQTIERSSTPFLMFNRKLVGNDPTVVHEYCTVSWNGFNGNGIFCVRDVDPARLESVLKVEEIEDWKTEGNHLLLIEQSNIGRSKVFSSLDQYYQTVRKTASSPVVFRKKPIGEKNIKPTAVRAGLVGAKAVVNLNSTISVEALIAGVPVVSLDAGDPTFAITSHNINEITYPDRLPLLQYLAHCQWHYTEVESGSFWEHIYPIQGKKLHEWTATGTI